MHSKIHFLSALQNTAVSEWSTSDREDAGLANLKARRQGKSKEDEKVEALPFEKKTHIADSEIVSEVKEKGEKKRRNMVLTFLLALEGVGV